MMSLSLGPLALPTAPLVLWLCAWLSAWWADRLAIRWGAQSQGGAGRALSQSVWIGLSVARLAHVVSHFEAYRHVPWLALDVRDGGWNALAGCVGGLAWLTWQASRRPAWRAALATSAVAGLLVWWGSTTGLDALAPRDVPDLHFTDLSTGRSVNLRETTAHHPVVVSLWATWCGPCRREMPILAAAQAEHPEVTFLFVNQGESADTVRRYMAEQSLRLSGVLLDTRSSLGAALGHTGLPTTVFFDRQGERVDAHLGALNSAALAIQLGRLLAP